LEVGPNREVVPYVSDNRPEKFGHQEGHHFKFQILGVENLEKNQKEARAHLSVSDTV
jgi:hypothetical protein